MASDFPTREIDTFDQLICGFTGGILRRAREIPEVRWNWSFSERTPTAREICEHTWLWLCADRQDLTVVDSSLLKSIPDPPLGRAEMLQLLENEMETWRVLLRDLYPENLDEMRSSPDGHSRTVRGYLFHMAQHVVSKSGQMTMLHFELGLDGGEPYDAPHPNRVYGFGSPDWPRLRIG